MYRIDHRRQTTTSGRAVKTVGLKKAEQTDDRFQRVWRIGNSHSFAFSFGADVGQPEVRKPIFPEVSVPKSMRIRRLSLQVSPKPVRDIEKNATNKSGQLAAVDASAALWWWT